jgi:pantothenate kinase
MADDLVGEVAAWVTAAESRVVLGLAGPPGAGKSTLALRLVDGVNQRLGARTAAYLPMDGFHLSNAQLDLLGRRQRKGAPDTFDLAGYLVLLGRLRAETDQPIYLPDYDRRRHEPIAARLAVHPGAKLVVTEGNYLASDAAGWREVRRHLDELWYVDAPDEVRERRLVDRARQAGLDERAARSWVRESDRPNGELVKPTRANCARVVR